MQGQAVRVRTDGVRKILAIELLGLGDNIHSLPVLCQLKRDFPDARLDVLVRKGNASLFEMVPWVHQTIPYATGEASLGLGGHIELLKRLRAERYDLVFNPSGNDRSTLLTWLSGGRLRVGRTQRKNNRRLWSLMHDEVLSYPYSTEPMFLQKLAAWRQLIPSKGAAGFHMETDGRLFDALALSADWAGRMIHVSAFASEDRRSLPLFQLVDLLEKLHARFPDHPLVISCAPTARETGRLAALLDHLSFKPGAVFMGTLDLPTLGALLRRCALHLGADSGALHLAWALGTPCVGWFRLHDGTPEWAPFGPRVRIVGTTMINESALLGVSTNELVVDAGELLALAPLVQDS